MHGMRTKLIFIGAALAGAAYLVGASPADTDPVVPAAPSATPAPPPLFASTEPAPAGQVLRVFVDPDRITGWMAGTISLAGSVAHVTIGGVSQYVTIDADNTFTLPYAVSAATEAVVEVGTKVQRVTLTPKAPAAPAALFVVDRNAYRPGDKLSFAGYLRRLDGQNLVPIANKPVKVTLVSDTRKTTAAKLSLVSDADGRISGEYRFSTGDPLDGYTLSIDGMGGAAHVTLAELRKSKVKLDVDATVEDRAAVLSLAAQDFLGAPAPGGSVDFVAQIVRDDEGEPHGALAPAQFVLGAPKLALGPSVTRAYLADPDAQPGATYATVVGEHKGTIALDAKGRGTYRIPLTSDLARGKHRLVVEATIVDANGREQRASRTIPLARRDVHLAISAPHEVVGAGTPVTVAVQAVSARGMAVPVAASVVAVKATPPASLGFLAFDNGLNNFNGYCTPNGGCYGRAALWYGTATNATTAQACRLTGRGCRSWQRRRAARLDDTSDVVAAVGTVVDGVATLALPDPGAYRLLVSARMPDGSTTWSEAGIAVREAASLPPVVVELDREEVRHGERITGRVQSLYRDAVALVVVRDATGIRAHRRLTLAGGRAEFDIPVGDTLGYGSAVEAYVVGKDDEVLAAQQLFHTRQTHRELAIEARPARTTYGPGDVVDLDISVGRPEAVELAVSVFDQSLLGVAPDRAVDPRDFFLADDRVRDRAALGPLAAQLGDLTVGTVLASAKAIAESPQPTEPELIAARAQAAQLVSAFQASQTTYLQLASLLQHAGVQATAQSPWSQVALDTKALAATRIVDLLAKQPALAVRRVGDTYVLGDASQQVVGGPVTTGGLGYAMGNASFSYASAPAAPSILAPGASSDLVRRDFSDSATWAVTRTGADGRAHVRFKLPDSLTTWRVVVTAIGRDAVGRSTSEIRTVRDVMVWPVLPRAFTEGDVVDISGNVRNLTDTARELAVALRATGATALSAAEQTVRVPARGTATVTWRIRAGEAGFASLRMTARSGADVVDASEKRIPIAPSAADQVATASGFADKPLTLALPAGIDPRDARFEVAFAPSLAADMVQTLDYLVEYPYGCAEQTMSRFAPAIDVAHTLDKLGITDGALVARLPAIVEAGVKRLAGMQEPDGGWAWNGHAQTHEMITPYVVWGLMMAERAGYTVPDGVVARGLARIRELIAARSGPADLSDRTYLAYVLAQRERLPDALWTDLAGKRDKMTDYALALALHVALGRGDRATAGAIVARLRGRAVRTSGLAHWTTGGFSRWGEDPSETTAVVLDALVAYDPDDALVPETIAYFVSTKRGDRWNSTKDTAMVLYAIADYLAKKGTTARDAKVTYTVDGSAPETVAFANGLGKRIPLPAKSSLTIAFPSASPGMLVRMSAHFHKRGRDLTPTAQGLEVTRSVFLVDGKTRKPLASGDRVPLGSYIESVVDVADTRHTAMRFLLVEDPKPAGAEPMPETDRRFPTVDRRWVLREDRESHVAYHHESVGDRTQVRTTLHVETTGELVMAPAQAELMYETDRRGSSGTFVLRVE